MNEEEQLKLAAQSGDRRAAYLYNQLLVERGQIELDNLALEGIAKFNNYESIPILIYILETAALNNYKLLAAIYLIELNAMEAASIFLRDLDSLRSTTFNENVYRNKLIDGLTKFETAAAVPILTRILADGEEYNDIRSHAARALVKLDPATAQKIIPNIWESCNTGLRRSLLSVFHNGGLFYLENLVEATADPDETTRQMAASNLINLILDTTLFGFEKPGPLPLEEIYKNNTKHLEIEHRIVKAIKALDQPRRSLDVICQNWQGLYNLLCAARIVRHFSRKIVQTYRWKIKQYLLDKENHDIGFRYRDTYPIVRAIRIALNLRDR